MQNGKWIVTELKFISDRLIVTDQVHQVKIYKGVWFYSAGNDNTE